MSPSKYGMPDDICTHELQCLPLPPIFGTLDLGVLPKTLQLNAPAHCKIMDMGLEENAIWYVFPATV